MRANRAFELTTSRSRPAFLAQDTELDRVEVVSIDDGEVVLFWEAPVRIATRLVRALRTDLAGLSAEEFIEKWQGADTAFEDES